MTDLLTVLQKTIIILTLSLFSLHTMPAFAQEKATKAGQTSVEENKTQHSNAAKSSSEDNSTSIAPILLGFLAAAGILIAISKKISSTAKHYDMKLTRTKPFWILAVAFIVAMILFNAGGVFDETRVSTSFADDTIWGIIIYLIALAVSYYMNAKQSSFLFAIPFTFFQAIAGAACIVLILGIAFKVIETLDKYSGKRLRY